MRLDEFLARALAARKMGLVDDVYGMKLPDDLWWQMKPDADHLIAALTFFDLFDIVRHYHGTEEGE